MENEQLIFENESLTMEHPFPGSQQNPYNSFEVERKPVLSSLRADEKFKKPITRELLLRLILWFENE